MMLTRYTTLSSQYVNQTEINVSHRVTREQMKRIILIMGLPGAGKTTLASALTPKLKAVWFNADEVRAIFIRILASPTRTVLSTLGEWGGFAARLLRLAASQ